MNGKQNGCTQNITQPLKSKETLAHATAYVILKGIALREIINTQKDKHCINSLM